ncbi:MAG: hypothetical protein FWC51_04260, partial [Proteobacteria bacterium]|nr:hypothetical protein [Pseudomonadota bacterium]
MPDKKNLFCASNPARLIDALWRVLTDGNHTDFADDIIFLPSRRAVRTIEKMIADHAGGAVMLPRLVALGEASDDEDEFAGGEFESTDNSLPPVALAKGGAQSTDVVSNLERTIMLSKMLSAQMNVGIAGAMPVAKDLIRMMDYLENENPGRDFNLDWSTLVGDQYAEHFRDKAQFLDVACRALPLVFPGRETVAQKRNRDILSWIEYLRMKDEGRKMTEKSDSNHPSSIIHHPSKIIVCGSTASVPATAALMAFIAGLDNGYIIFPGIPPQRGGADVVGEGGVPVTNPYYSEMHFLKRIGAAPGDVQRIDVGDSKIGFFNAAFENNFKIPSSIVHHPSSVRIDCARESEEAEVAAEIATDAASSGKSVLIITPDAAGNQRLRESFARRGVIADFSGGVSAAVAPWGRAVLNRIDIEIKSARRAVAVKDLFGMVSDFDLEFSESDAPTIEKIKEASDVLQNNGIVLDLTDVRAVAAEAMASVQIRPPMTDDCKISVLGTIESRMQTADVVILTGLNEGMFPALGYENPWLPRRVADTIGLPPPERKVSLMAMDFMTLSCGPVVYWTRSKMSGGGETTESRFLSRVSVADVGAR